MVKNQARKKRIIVARRLSRLHVFGIIVVVLVLGISAVSVLSRQTAKGREPNKPEAVPAAPKANKNFVTRKVAGQDVHIDSETGEIQPLTPQEAEKMTAGLATMVNQSTEGLDQVPHPDGSVSMDLEGRFQNVTVARVNKDGTVTTSCVDNPRAAGAFFGIDPQKIENAQKAQPRTKFNPN
jgi:hypothetical protein